MSIKILQDFIKEVWCEEIDKDFQALKNFKYKKEDK